MGKQLLSAVLGLGVAFAASAQQPYQNASLPTEQRVDDLLSRMTLEEKVAQLQTVWQKRRTLEDKELQFLPEKAKELIPVSYTHLTLPTTPYV